MHVADSYTILKYGTGIFTDVSEIEFEKRVFEPNSISIVCHPDLSPVVSQQQATTWKDQFFNDQNIFFAKTLESKQAYSLTIPKNYSSAESITLGITANHRNALCNLHITIEENADVTLVEKIEPQEYLGLNVLLNIAPNSRVKYLIIQDTDEAAYNMITRTGNVSKDASLEWIDIELGGNITKSDIRTNLIGEGAQTNVCSLFFGSDKQTIDMYTATRHIAPHTKSDMQTKGLLNGQAKAISRGLIHIDHDALKSVAFERIDTLLLSNDGQMNAVPELEIENSDVKCSHAVTTTRVNEEKMFYMLSKGVGESDAIRLATLAHISAIVEKLPEHMREDLIQKVEAKLV